jgi:UDP-N-acetylglucosamine 4,6-dehydratase
MFSKKTILITGGTGSFGQAFIAFLLKNYNPKKIIIFSRDEFKQFSLSQKINKFKTNTKIRFFIGDVRDLQRLNLAFKGVDYVVHAAALKHIPIAEYNPQECIKTNVVGSENVIFAALEQKVKKVIALSTDKACSPVNLYGATKLAADKLFTAANVFRGSSDFTKFSVVRYGNVINSRGSVFSIYDELIKKNSKTLPLTDSKMTRFFISLNDGVKFVAKSFERMREGEIFVPKIPTIKIIDLVKSFKAQPKIIGIRPGEKIHETLCIKDEANLTIDFKDHYIVIPSTMIQNKNIYKINMKKEVGKFVKENFEYNSGNNKEVLNLSKIDKILNNLKS